jgi:hypothetical protein
MLHETTLSRTRDLGTALDRRRLQALGLQHVRELASATWTDHNTHDPGITTLELLSYALTDLGYRATFPVEDLLATPEDNAAQMAARFFTARQSLTNRPFTLGDHRKSLIDLPGVKNAWLLPSPLTTYADTTRGVLLGPATLLADELLDAAALVRVLRDAADPLGVHLLARFAARTRAAVAARPDDDAAPDAALRALLLGELNNLILGPALHAPAAFARVTLSTDAQALLAANPAGEALARLHRLLLEDTLPGVIAPRAVLRERGSAPGVVPVEIRGLYDVRLELMEMINTLEERTAVLEAAWARLMANRTLAEDFVSVAEIEAQAFLLCGEIELEPAADPVEVKARVFAAVQEYLAPTLRARTLAEVRAPAEPDTRALTVDEAFEGPALEHGLLTDDDLACAELRSEVRLSDVMGLITDVPGVVAIRTLIVNPRDAEAVPDPWVVPVAPGHQARLDLDRSRLICTKRLVPVPVRVDAWRPRYDALRREALGAAESPGVQDLPIPLGRHRDPAAYTSVQNHFPALYGIGPDGVSAGAAERPRAEALARQLKGYLLFFDQLLADSHAQLAHVGDLLSDEAAIDRTRFPQPVTSFRDHATIYREALDEDGFVDEAPFRESPESFAQRRHRFLDHLLARRAESLDDTVQITRSVFGTSDAALIQAKCEFLRHHPEISSERALAYNRTLSRPAEVWNSDNVSGLEKRLARLLGLPNHRRRNLSEIAHDIYAEVDATPDNEFRWRIRHHETGEILLSSSTHYATRAAARAEMFAAIRHGMTTAAYERKVASNGSHYFNVVDPSGEVLARRIAYFRDVAAMEAAIDALVDHLTTRYSDDGMFVIEMLTLRPELSTDPLLPICVDPQCTSCSDLDPYSHRLHILLPAFSARFSNMDFRRFAEATIRAEVPAHLLPRICWIDRDTMAVVEKAYRDWLAVKSGAAESDRSTRLRALVDALQAARNVYPPGVLRSCDSTTTEDRFVLGRSSLGTLSDEQPQPPSP